MEPADFASLHSHSHMSILDGFSTIDEYLDMVEQNGQKALGLTDHGNGYALYDFITKARQRSIIPVPGVEAYLAPDNPEGAKAKHQIFYGKNGVKSGNNDVSANGAYLHQTIWAVNNTGMHNLFKLISLSNQQENFYKAPRMDFEMLAEHSDGLVVATGCPSSEISTRFLLGQDDKAYEYANRLKEVFGDRLFVEIMDHNMKIDLERKLLPKQLDLSKKLNLPLLATIDSHYAKREHARHHEELLCSQSGARMSDKTYNEGGPRFAFEGNEYYLKSTEEMSNLFPEEDYPNALTNTMLIAEMAQDINLEFDPNLKAKAVIPTGYTEESYLKHLIKIGLKERYGNADREVKQEAMKRVKEEFEVLYSSDFIGYILTVHEYLDWTKKNYATYDDNNNVIAYPVGVGRGCFLPGNKVRTGKGERNIEKMGEPTKSGKPFTVRTVLTHDGTQKNVENFFIYNVENEDCIEITLENEKVITCTSDHKIFLKGKGYVEARKLKVGNELLGAKKFNVHNEFKIKKIRQFKYSGKVYDIQVADTHNYTISGVTVHNSVGGSIIAFLLGISEVDPIRYDLLFSRFLSAGRGATYEISYDDGTTEEIIVSEKKKVRNSNGTIKYKYIHQLVEGDEIID